MLIGAVANIALDPLFIFTLQMGVRSISLATILSQLLSCICVMGFFGSQKSLFRFRVREIAPDWGAAAQHPVAGGSRHS